MRDADALVRGQGLMKCTEITALEIDSTDIDVGSLPSDLLAFLKERGAPPRSPMGAPRAPTAHTRAVV